MRHRSLLLSGPALSVSMNTLGRSISATLNAALTNADNCSFAIRQTRCCKHVTSRRLSAQNSVSGNHDIQNNEQQPLQYDHDGSGRKEADKLISNSRPRNSYLKIIMDDTVFDQLHHTVCQLRRLWEEGNNTNDPHQQSISTKQSKQHLTIKPRARNSLHMTYFFAGRVLEEMACEEVQRWQTMVKKCVVAHSNGSPGNYALHFKSVIVFPPGRNDLIVAVFEASSALKDLHAKLCELAVMETENMADSNVSNDNSMGNEISGKSRNNEKEYEFPLLRELTLNQEKQRKQHRSPSWVAHVTLGNLAGGSKDEVNRLSKWVAGRAHQLKCIGTKSNDDNSPPSSVTSAKPENESEPLQTSIAVLGLALGGPVPGHTDIVWNFPIGDAVFNTNTNDNARC